MLTSFGIKNSEMILRFFYLYFKITCY